MAGLAGLGRGESCLKTARKARRASSNSCFLRHKTEEGSLYLSIYPFLLLPQGFFFFFARATVKGCRPPPHARALSLSLSLSLSVSVSLSLSLSLSAAADTLTCLPCPVRPSASLRHCPSPSTTSLASLLPLAGFPGPSDAKSKLSSSASRTLLLKALSSPRAVEEREKRGRTKGWSLESRLLLAKVITWRRRE